MESTQDVVRETSVYYKLAENRLLRADGLGAASPDNADNS